MKCEKGSMEGNVRILDAGGGGGEQGGEGRLLEDGPEGGSKSYARVACSED